MKAKTLLLVLFFQISFSVFSQNENKENLDKLTPKEFAIPTSPLFDLMGVAPSQVAKTSDIKDFKVDWSFKSWKLSPNLAIQSQPIWELFYNKKTIEKYQKASWLNRSLSSLDISIGTVQDSNDDRRIGGAVKINLYKQKDPLLADGAYAEIETQFNDELISLKENEKLLLHQLDSVTKSSDIKELKNLLKENDEKLNSSFARKSDAIKSKAAEFVNDNWNSAFIDLAYGRISTYETDSIGSFKKLRLNRNTASGAWLNFGFGVGRKGLISGLLRTSFYEEELNFDLKNTDTDEITTLNSIASNRLYTLGINFRYGGAVYNFFAELIAEKKHRKTALDALTDSFTPSSNEIIIPESVKWDAVQPYTINVGGDWRISRNVVLNYGIRAIMNNNFKTTSVIPIANISCMMR